MGRWSVGYTENLVGKLVGTSSPIRQPTHPTPPTPPTQAPTSWSSGACAAWSCRSTRWERPAAPGATAWSRRPGGAGRLGQLGAWGEVWLVGRGWLGFGGGVRLAGKTAGLVRMTLSALSFVAGSCFSCCLLMVSFLPLVFFLLFPQLLNTIGSLPRRALGWLEQISGRVSGCWGYHLASLFFFFPLKTRENHKIVASLGCLQIFGLHQLCICFWIICSNS